MASLTKKAHAYVCRRLYRAAAAGPPHPAPDARKKSYQVHNGLTAWRLENVCVWPAYSVAAHAGRFVAETLEQPKRVDNRAAIAGCRRYPATRVAGVTTSIGATYQNYYHRMVDMLPKVWHLHHAGLGALGPITLVLPDSYPVAERELVRAMLPAGVQMAVVSPFRRIETDAYLYLPQLSNHPDKPRDVSSAGFLPVEYLRFFRERAFSLWGLDGSPVGGVGSRLFISREGAAVRRLVNEREVREALGRRGFRTLRLETMPLGAQAAAFNAASVIVAQHGAGLTNLLYTRPGCRVLEVQCEGSSRKTYSSLEDKLGLSYATVPAEPVEDGRGPARHVADRDAVLDVSTLCAMIEAGW